MRVLINALAAAGARTGVGHYIAQLVRCLEDQAGPGTIDSFPGPLLRQAWRVWAKARPRLVEERPRARETGRPGKPGWRGRWLGRLRVCGRAVLAHRFRAASRRGYDLYHEPNFIPFACGLPTVATIHDLSALLHPEWHPADRAAHFERHFHQGLKRCDHFLAISECARREIIQTLGLRPERVTRTYMGVRPGLGPLPRAHVAAALARLGLPPRYLLYLGTLEPRKNVLTLLRAYCALPDRVRSEYPLVLVGGWGWNSGDVADYLDRAARHRGVRHLGYLPESELAVLYNGARTLAFPSFYEGFGLPPVEMLACGGAVLASTAGALAETVGDQAHLVEPLDVDGWRDALLRVTTDDDWWQFLRHGAVEHARRFTWEQCAADTLGVYRKLCGEEMPAEEPVRVAG
jgi:alpha-1,3-rhamnosyl/mannosyltransferase